MRVLAGVASLASGAFDLALPPRCVACLEPAWGDDVLLCADCAALVPAPAMRCDHCARRVGALAHGLGGCPACAGPLSVPDALAMGAPGTRPGPLHAAVAAWSYGDTPRALVLALKFGGRLRAATILGEALADALQEVGCPGDLLVPVPLSRRRAAERGFNQATCIADEVARRLGPAVDARALRRRRDTASQTSLSRRGRLRGPRGAFAAVPRRVRGRVVILVDDVLTSGATARACALALRRAGAVRVVVGVACRAE